MTGLPSRTSIWSFRYHHRSATRRCSITISIHHCDRLCLKTISWRLWLSNPQRKHSRQLWKSSKKYHSFYRLQSQRPCIRRRYHSTRKRFGNRTYRKQIWSHLLLGEKALEATEILKIAVNRFENDTPGVLNCSKQRVNEINGNFFFF